MQTKQNHAICLIFFARTFGKLNNVYRLHALRFTRHLRHKNLLPNVFHDFLQYASSLHTFNTRYAASQSLYKSRVRTTPGNKLYPMWLPSFGIIFLLIWKLLTCTSFLNKLSCISSLNNSKIPWSNEHLEHLIPLKNPLLIWFGLSPCVCTLFTRLFQFFNLILFCTLKVGELENCKVHLFSWLYLKHIYFLS